MSVFDGLVRLADPPMLLAFPALLWAFAVAARRGRAGDGGGVLFSSLGLLPRARETWRVRYRWLVVPLRALALVLLVLALARPQIALAALDSGAEGIDIALVLDTSSSMTARDFGGTTRMEGAKSAMRAFVGGLKNDRAGVVLFSAEAMELAPLTLDYGAIDRLIEPIVAGRPLRDGTAIGVGLATGVGVLRDSVAKSKVLILFTDGENNAGEVSPLDAAELAKVLGIRVYTVGAIGGSEVDERALRDLAERTGGQYFRASNRDGMLAIYRDIQGFEKSRFPRRDPESYGDVYPLLLGPALLLLAIEVALGMSLFRRVP